MNDSILYTVENSIATVIINRPKELNALNQEVLLELEATLNGLSVNEEAKVIIITGSGTKAFVAGADIAAMRIMNPDEARQFSQLGQRVLAKVENMPQTVIAAINGFALGGGCELAMACDIRVSSPKSKFAIPEVTLGVIPGFGGTQRLPRLVGLGIAKELLATGRQINADEGKAYGLLNYVVAEEELMPFCLEMAGRIAANSSTAISYGKKCMNAATEMDLVRALDYESAMFGLTFSTPDQDERMDAFLVKRKAKS